METELPSIHRATVKITWIYLCKAFRKASDRESSTCLQLLLLLIEGSLTIPKANQIYENPSFYKLNDSLYNVV